MRSGRALTNSRVVVDRILAAAANDENKFGAGSDGNELACLHCAHPLLSGELAKPRQFGRKADDKSHADAQRKRAHVQGARSNAATIGWETWGQASLTEYPPFCDRIFFFHLRQILTSMQSCLDAVEDVDGRGLYISRLPSTNSGRLKKLKIDAILFSGRHVSVVMGGTVYLMTHYALS